MNKLFFLGIFLGLGFSILLVPIPASEAMRMVWGLEQMVEKSDVIAIGTIESTWIDIRPFDEYLIVDTAKVRVDEWLKNERGLDTLEIRYYGYWAKTIDDLRGRYIFDNPVHSYDTGQRVLVLATYEKPTMMMGEGYYPFYEGKFVINGDMALSQAGDQMKLTELYDVVRNSTKDAYSEIKAQSDLLPPCTSYRTACFNQDTNACDPSGWECKDTEDIFDVIIKHPTYFTDESTSREHYEIEIIRLKDEYSVNEPYSFYFVISGFGYACASYEITYPDENGNIMKTAVDVLCAAEQSMMQEFEINYLEIKGTLGNMGIKNPGTYTVTVTFEKPNKFFPTTVSKDFRVVEN